MTRRLLSVSCAGGDHARCRGRSAYAPIRCGCDCHCSHFSERYLPLHDGTGVALIECTFCGAVDTAHPVGPPYDQDATP